MGTAPGDLEMMQQAVREGETILDAEARRLERRATTRLVIGVMAAVLLVGCWMFRYEIVASGGQAGISNHLKLDRWTGTVYLCAGNGRCFDLSRPMAEQKIDLN